MFGHIVQACVVAVQYGRVYLSSVILHLVHYSPQSLFAYAQLHFGGDHCVVVMLCRVGLRIDGL